LGTTLTKNGSGVQALSGANTYTGATQINDGILVFRTIASKAAGTVTAAAAGSIGLGVKDADAAFYSAADVDALFNTNSLPGFVLAPASGVGIDTNAASFDQTIALTAARSLTKLGGNTLTLSQANTYSGATIVNNGTLSLTGSLDGGGAISTIGTSVFSQTSTGVISGAATFTQGSTGTSTLAGTNTYTGVTNVNLGQLVISNPAALGTTDGNTIVTSGGRLAMSTASLSVAEPLTITGTGTTATNGALAFGGGFTGMALTGPITLGGAARIQADGNTGSNLSGGISLGANELTINTDGGATQTIDTTAITGTGGSLVKSGGGTLVLGGANSFTGATTVNAGALRITNAGALGTTAAGSVVNGSITGSSSNARIDLSGGVTVTGEAATLNGAGNFAGALTSSSGNNIWAGPVTIGSAGTRIGASVGASLEVSGVIDSGVDPHGLVIRTTDLTGVVVFSGANTYLGTTQVLIGKLQLAGGNNRLPVGTTLEFASSGTNPDAELDLNGMNQEVAALALGGSGVATKNSVNNSSVTLSTLTVNTPAATPSTFAGILKGNLALVKAGADTLTLSGVNTYSGDTTVNGGILSLANADSALDANTGNDASTVTIAATAGATLDLAYTGTDEVNALFIGGVQKSPGVWGSATSGAPNTDPKLTGTGTLTVATGPVTDNYASWAALNGVTGGPNGDSDNDGVKNLVEYALADGQERGTLTGSTLSFTKRGAPYGADLTYAIETSDNLGISDPWAPVTPTVNNATTISYILQNPGDNFARLKVTQVP
jgi:autotransporter-associated beta strand protein